RDHCAAELAGTALPRHVAGRIDPLLLEQRLVEVTVGAFQRAHEGALLGPALPLLVLLLLGIFVGLVVTNARPYLIVHARHCGPPRIGCGLRDPCRPLLQASCGGTVRCHYVITGRCATLAAPPQHTRFAIRNAARRPRGWRHARIRKSDARYAPAAGARNARDRQGRSRHRAEG